VDNKRTGAYSIGGSFGLDKKYILMNFDESIRSVATLAHEIGHSMHSYYSDNEQPINLASYPIFLAEIASIFNELMLQDYLLNNTKDDKLKFHLLSEAIEDFEGTVRRQTM
jgi:oligoendopeptidase F